MSKKPKALYTPMEVSKLTGCPKSTVYEWADKGILTTVQMGTQRLIPLAALKAHALVWESIVLANKAA